MKKFATWIDRVGVIALMKKLGVSRQIISLWRNGRSVPRPYLALRMVRMSKGELTFEHIYKPAALRQQKAKKRSTKNRR